MAIVFVVAMRLLRTWLLIRLNPLFSFRLGHFAANTELYLCEREAGINQPVARSVDLCYFNGEVANRQLAVMWARQLTIWPRWLMGPVATLNRVFPGGSIHQVGSNSKHDRDVHNLLERFPSHLRFTPDEEMRGRQGLAAMGIPADRSFICVVSRDSAYLSSIAPKSNPDLYRYHDYRDVDIQNFALTADALAELGHYVIRMGSVAKAPLRSSHPRVIDYATNAMRNEFMDVYLCANCLFCISVGSGLDAISLIFRRPIAYVNFAPIGHFGTFTKDALFICKKHWLKSERRWLSMREIFSNGVGFCSNSSCFETRGVELVENTPEEIRSLAIEMLQRLNGKWMTEPDDDALQRRFWELYPVGARDSVDNLPLQGTVRARYGTNFLRDNRDWLE